MANELPQPRDWSRPDDQVTDVTELIYKDDLTGLYNRRYLREYLAHQVPWEDENPEPISLLMIDVDHFKQINDTHGHLTGDRVLRHIAQVLRASFRASDEVIRYAGDEFIVILPGAEKKVALSLAERTLKKIKEMSYLDMDGATEIPIGLSIGVACFPEDGRDPEALIDRADKALYRSKEQGRGRVSAAVSEKVETLTPAQVLQNFPCRALVERDELLEELAGYLPGSDCSPTPIVVVEGESGVGKTRLLLELLKSTEEEGITWLMERCSEEYSHAPYHVLRTLLSQYIADHPGQITTALRKMSVREMRCLLEEVPELAGTVPLDSPLGPLTLRERRELFFDALSNLFCRISLLSPLAIVLDEFQHVDIGTLYILLSLATRSDARITVYAALRASSVLDKRLEGTPLHTFCSRELEEHGNLFIEVRVPLLGREGVTKMISTIFEGREENDEFDEALFRLCRGNPLHLEEILKDMVQRGLIRHVNGRWEMQLPGEEALPASLDDAIRSHLSKLDKETADIIARAAVIGPNFRLDMLRSVTDLNLGFALEALDKAREAGIVDFVPNREDEEAFFRNPRLREVSYVDLDPAVKRRTHEKVAEVGEELHKEDIELVAPYLAHHYERAGNEVKAKEFEEKAHVHARRVFDIREAVTYTHKRVAARIKEGDKPLSPAALARLASALQLCCDAINLRGMGAKARDELRKVIHSIYSELQYVFAEVEVVTVKQAAEKFSVNGVAVAPKVLGKPAMKFFDILRKHNGEGLTIAHGVFEREISVLIDALVERGNVFVGLLWSVYLGENEVRNIYVEQRVARKKLVRSAQADKSRLYAPKRAAQVKERPQPPEEKKEKVEQKVPEPEPQQEEKATPEEKTEEKSIAEKEEEPIKAPPTTLDTVLSKQAAAVVKESAEKYAMLGDAPSLSPVMDGIEQRLVSQRIEVKLQAAEILEEILDISSRLGSSLLLEKSAEILRRRVAAEEDLSFSAKLADVAGKAISIAIKLGEYEVARSLVWTLNGESSTARGGKRHVQLVMQRIARGDAMSMLLDDLRSEDVERQNAAASVIAGLGDYGTLALLDTLKNCESFRVRKSVAEIIRWTQSMSGRLVLSCVSFEASEDECDRVMSVFDVVSRDLERDIQLALAHSNRHVRLGAVRLMARIHKPWALRILFDLVASDDEELAVEAIRAIGDSGIVDAGEGLLAILPALSSGEMEKECYLSLGKLRYAPAIEVLERAAFARRFLGIFGGKRQDIRQAATWAIGQISGERALTALQKLCRDPDEMVAEEAKRALAFRVSS